MLRKANDYYQDHNHRAYIYAGTNIGEEREASDWVLSTNTLTLAPAFGSAIDATSEYELHYIFIEDEYRKAINLAIESVVGKYLIDKIDVTTVLVADIYEYTLPADMYYIHRIITEKAANGGVFDASDEVDPRDWELISPRKLKLHEDRYSITAGKDLRIEGQGKQDTVSSDTDLILLPPDWLVAKAITFLPQAKIQSNKLDEVYRRALITSIREPTNAANPYGKKVIE
tara:strand:- start:15872 stop:16558 length:687 start_codon:yes stop_codon:yes gene_type:complete